MINPVINKKYFTMCYYLISLCMLSFFLFGCANDSKPQGNTKQQENETQENVGKQENVSFENESVLQSCSEELSIDKSGNSESDGSQSMIGIRAHIKEIKDGSILVSSDTDYCPGVFQVKVPDSVYDCKSLSGGDLIYILMTEENTNEEIEGEAVKNFLAQNISIPEKETAQVDLLLTSAPAITLTDILSSQSSEFTVRSGNYTWNYKEQDQIIGEVACGMHPLDESAINSHEILKIPTYQNTDAVTYLASYTIPPDVVTIMEWDSKDAGNMDAASVFDTTFYSYYPFINLKPNRIYEITAEWKEENLENNGFFGIASYAFVTQ